MSNEHSLKDLQPQRYDLSIKNTLSELNKILMAITLDEQGFIIFANLNFQKYIDKSKEEILNHKIDEFLLESEIPNFYNNLKNFNTFIAFYKGTKGVMLTAKVIVIEIHKDSKVFYVLYHVDITNNLADLQEIYFNIILNEVLKLAIEIPDLKKFLDEFLQIIVNIPWLAIQKKAGVMIYQDDELRLISYLGVSDSLVKMCNKVALGQCLCGEAAVKKEIIFKSHVDDDHNNRPEGMKPHGHYNVPIMKNEQLLGVLFLYIEDGSQFQPVIKEFLEQIAQVLSAVILRFKMESEFQYSIVKLIRTNEEMVKSLKKIQHLESFINLYVPSTIKKLLNQPLTTKQINFNIEKNCHLLINFSGLGKFGSVFPIQKVYETLQKYYAPIVDTIIDYGGELEQYLEDRILGIFKSPENIIDCAIQIKKIITDINEERKSFLLKPFDFQIVMNCGESFFGIVGGTKRKNWIRFSDTIRELETLQKRCDKNHIMLTENLYKNFKNKYKFSKPYKIILSKEKEMVVYYLEF